jgi:hypothetical protein
VVKTFVFCHGELSSFLARDTRFWVAVPSGLGKPRAV